MAQFLKKLHFNSLGRGGQVVSVLTFYFNDPSSNAAEVCNVYPVNCMNGTKINNKEDWVDHFYMISRSEVGD